MIETELLRYLVEFSKSGSLSKAGEALHLSQPSLSKAMQKLEQELGIDIFERSKNKLVLNTNGLIILDYAKDILKIQESMFSFAKEVKEKNEEVLIGMCAPGPLFHYAGILKGTSKFGKYVTEIIDDEEELCKNLYNGKYDLVFLSEPIQKEGYFCQRMFKEHLYVSLPKEHFLSKSKESLTFEDIDGQTFLMDAKSGVWKDIIKKHLPKSRIIFQEDEESLMEMREHSSLLSFVTDLSQESSTASNRINIPLSDEDATMSFYIMLKEHWTHCFKEFLK